MIKIYLKNLLLTLIAVTSVVHAAQPSKTGKTPTGTWGVNIENENKIGLYCDDYNGYVTCEMLWFFTEIRVLTKTEGSVLKIYTGKNENDALFISLKNGSPYKFLPGGILTPQYFAKYEPLRFKSYNDSKTDSYGVLKTKVDKLYHLRGSLQELPATLPAWVMNPSIHLFKNQNEGSYIGLNRVLEHPALTTDVLQEMHTFFSTNGKSYQFELINIARNPSTSPSTLDQLFAFSATKRLHTSIWNAVSANANAPSNYRDEYYKRVKEGNEKTHTDLLGDLAAPADLLDWIARNGKFSYFNSSMYYHANLTAETLDFLIDNRSSYDSKRHMVNHPNISDTTLLKLARMNLDNQSHQNTLLELILRHRDKGQEAVQVALELLAHDKQMGWQAKAAADERLNRELIKLLIKSESIKVRSALASNKKLIYGDLVTLIGDAYAPVSKPARVQLEKRFPKTYARLSVALPPLSELNPAYSFSNQLSRNVIDNDLEAVKETIQALNHTKQSTQVDVTPALKSGNIEMVKLLASINKYRLKKLVAQPDFNGDWLRLFMETESLKSLDQYTALATCLRANRLDYAQILIDSGYDINAKRNRKNENLLSLAIIMRNEKHLDFLLDSGIDTQNTNGASKRSPVNLAKQLNFIYAVEKLDKTGKYAAEIAAFKKEHTPDKNSPVIGDWSNLESGFKTSTLSLSNDGTGRMMSSVSGFLLTWKALKNGEFQIIPIIKGKSVPSKKFVIHYEASGTRLTIKIDKNKSLEYYRIESRTASEIVRTGDHNIDKQFINTWVDEKTKTTITINVDGTALVNHEADYAWVKIPNNILTAYSVKDNKLDSSSVITLSLTEDKKELVIGLRNGESIVLPRKKTKP